jgi:hypothetical protein
MRVTSILRSGRSAWKGIILGLGEHHRLTSVHRSVFRRISEPTGCTGQQCSHNHERTVMYNPTELCRVSEKRKSRILVLISFLLLLLHQNTIYGAQRKALSAGTGHSGHGGTQVGRILAHQKEVHIQVGHSTLRVSHRAQADLCS